MTLTLALEAPAARPRRRRRLGRVLVGAAVLALLVARLGTGPFVEGLRQVDVPLLAVGLLVGVVTTVAAAWRWRVVAEALEVGLPLRAAVASSYRAQFLNASLPGGVVGDVHRGVCHGLDAGDVGRGMRSVVWDRVSGQVVQVALTVAVVALLPSPVGPWAIVAIAVVATLLLGAVLLHGRSRRSRYGSAARAALSDLRTLTARTAWPPVVGASVVAVSGFVALFVVSARATGVPATTAALLPLALLALLAMAVPANVAGWGPREGVAAWAFAAAGLGASTGVATAVVYGVLSFTATLPGAVVLVVAWARRPVARLEGAPHG